MEDLIMKEINQIGKMLEAIFTRIGPLRRSGDPVSITEITKTELLGKLNINLDELLVSEHFTDTLRDEYGFSNDNLEKFAEILFLLATTTPEEEMRKTLVSEIKAIYGYLGQNSSSCFYNRYYILSELERYK